MPLPENKTLFKTMDIKTAFLAANNRKRKATSPTVHSNQAKHIKTSEDKKLNEPSDDEIEIICQDSDMIAIGECKENTDTNVLNNEHNTPLSEKLCTSKDVQTDSDKLESFRDSKMVCDDNSLKSSSDELNSSNLNNSVNTQNSSELSDDALDKSKNTEGSQTCPEAGGESKLTDSTTTNQNVPKTKRKKKMSSEEAKKRAEVREEKRKQALKKKEELNAQKLQKRLEKEKQKMEKLEKQEREKMEKEEKERIRKEKKEQEEKEKQQKLKEKEEQKKQRQMMLEMKQEEKKKKEEMKLQREAEMKKVEEEKQKAKLEKEQKEKEKQERNKAAFLKFFVNKTVTSPSIPQKVVEKEGAFKPFQVSDDMTLAPVVPLAAQERFNKEYLDQALKCQDKGKLYLQILKAGNYKDVRLRKRLRRKRLCDDDVLVVENIEPSELFLTAKLLQFSENVRPPYWGTWRKRSRKIRPRNPFGEDDIFDYTVDSDDEWDEGGPGESLSGTENEIESEDDYEVDNEFFVPHGYLSAEEENEEEEEVVNDPEKQKALLKLKQQEFEKERKKKTTELKPIILGCFFENVSQFQDLGLGNFLQAYTSEILTDTPIPTRFTLKKLAAESKLHSNASSPTNGSASAVKKKVPEEAMPYLIQLLHGNVNRKGFLKKEFQVFWHQHCQALCPIQDAQSEHKESMPGSANIENIPGTPKTPTELTITDSSYISLRQLTLLIKEISTYGKCPNPNMKKFCWYVHDNVREKYGLLDAPIPNEWNYVTSKDEAEASPASKSNSVSIKDILMQQ